MLLPVAQKTAASRPRTAASTTAAWPSRKAVWPKVEERVCVSAGSMLRLLPVVDSGFPTTDDDGVGILGGAGFSAGTLLPAARWLDAWSIEASASSSKSSPNSSSKFIAEEKGANRGRNDVGLEPDLRRNSCASEEEKQALKWQSTVGVTTTAGVTTMSGPHRTVISR